MADTHTIMPKKLAQALMDSSMQHFDGGGLVGALGVGNGYTAGGTNNIANAQTQFGQQQDVYGQQQALAQQLLAQSQGQGPAQNLVAAQGAQNQAQMAATMAGARGASANPAAIARQAAIQGQQGQQQVLNSQAQATLGGQSALAQQQSNMANQAIQGQSVSQGAISAANNVNAAVAGQNASANQGLLGGVLGGVGGAISSLFGKAKGGEVQHLDMGGPVNDNIGIAQFGGSMPNFLGTSPASGSSLANGLMGLAGNIGGTLSNAFSPSLSPIPGEADGGRIPFGQMLAGGNVPGKAPMKGDHKENDIVPTLLSPGEDVIPKSITELPEKQMEKKAIEFLRHLKLKKRGYQAVAESRRAKSS